VTKMVNIYREESPMAIYTRFDANIAVATTCNNRLSEGDNRLLVHELGNI